MKTHRGLIIAVTILTITLIISLALNFALYLMGERYYLQLNATRLDPLGLSVYPQQYDQQTAKKDNKPTVVFFGDSRAFQWSAPVEVEQFEFINRGIGAQTSTQVVERFENHIEPLSPDVLIVQVCINDLKTIPLFPHLKSSIVDTCKVNLERIVIEAQKQGSVVILTTVFPLGRLPIERSFFWSDDVGEAIKEVNSFIYSLPRENVIIFDSEAILAGEDGTVRQEYSQDFLHLNEAGYKALNSQLVSVLRNLD